MLAMGLTRVVLPLIGLLEFSLHDFVVVGLGVDLLVTRFHRYDGHRLIRRFDGSGVPILSSLLPCSSSDQPSLELIRFGHR